MTAEKPKSVRHSPGLPYGYPFLQFWRGQIEPLPAHFEKPEPVHRFTIDKDHWFDMSYPTCPIPTDPADHVMPVLPLADKAMYYAIGTKGGCRRMLFSRFYLLSSLLIFFLNRH